MYKFHSTSKEGIEITKSPKALKGPSSSFVDVAQTKKNKNLKLDVFYILAFSL